MAPSFSQVMDTEVEVVKTQSNLAGDPWATIKSLGGLVNATEGREGRLHVVLGDSTMGVPYDDIINLIVSKNTQPCIHWDCHRG